MLDEEITKPTKVINILESEPSRIDALERLKNKNLSTSVILEFSYLTGLGAASSLEELKKNADKALFNPVTKLMYEDRARTTILGAIYDDVIAGENDLVVLDGDINNLKGLNDSYGDPEANKGIEAYARFINAEIVDAALNAKQDIKFAIINKYGEGSDSIKVILIGKNLYDFSRKFYDKLSKKKVSLELRKKVSLEEEQVNVTGGWGFYVMKNDDVQKLKQNIADGEIAGNIYQSSSVLAEERLSADKVRDEAELINNIFNVTNLIELRKLRDQVQQFGTRIPRIILDYYFNKEKDLEKLKFE